MEEPGRLQSMGSLRVGLHFHFSLSRIGKGNGNPLQYSCLGNPMDREDWQATVHGAAKELDMVTQLVKNLLAMQETWV